MIRHGVMAAGRGGKLKTVLQTVALMLFIFPIRILQDDWGVAGDVLWVVAVLAMVAAVTVTLVTGADYVVKALAVRRDGRSRSRLLDHRLRRSSYAGGRQNLG